MEWINVNDRLPEPGQLVLAVFPQQWHLAQNARNHGSSPDWNATVRELVSENGHRWADQGVTHWAPFEPPKNP